MKIKAIICAIVGHKFQEPSIINTICSDDWLKRCSRCGLYHMHSGGFGVTLTKTEALKIKRGFEEAFPYSVKGGGENGTE
jgi:hypothetical protein